MATLTEFLLARIGEDEARARPMWELKVRQRIVGAPIVPLSWPTPDRVLAECEAKRRIVEVARENVRVEALEHGDKPRDDAHFDSWCDVDEILRALATPYADHPDFHEEWRA